MMRKRSLVTLFAAAVLLGSLGASESRAQFFYNPPGPYVMNPVMQPMMMSYQFPVMSSYTYSSYVAPYPAYGILPPPFQHMFDSNNGYGNGYGQGSNLLGYQKTAEDYGYSRDYFDQAPRKRAALYPAVPFEAGPQDKDKKTSDPLTDARRVRIEVTAPTTDATVLIDGNMTRQAGTQRVFVTPALEEDRLYSFTLELRWIDASGKEQTAKHTYDNVFAGDVKYYPPKGAK